MVLVACGLNATWTRGPSTTCTLWDDLDTLWWWKHRKPKGRRNVWMYCVFVLFFQKPRECCGVGFILFVLGTIWTDITSFKFFCAIPWTEEYPQEVHCSFLGSICMGSQIPNPKSQVPTWRQSPSFWTSRTHPKMAWFVWDLVKPWLLYAKQNSRNLCCKSGLAFLLWPNSQHKLRASPSKSIAM